MKTEMGMVVPIQEVVEHFMLDQEPVPLESSLEVDSVRGQPCPVCIGDLGSRKPIDEKPVDPR